eukprot:SAG11_NODE_11247_length_774_cov_0.862222_2_plen_69_part_00
MVCTQYLEASTIPLYRFGAGLSYGQTAFSGLQAPTGARHRLLHHYHLPSFYNMVSNLSQQRGTYDSDL